MRTNNLFRKANRSLILIIVAISLLFITVTAFVAGDNTGSVDKELCMGCGNCWSLDPEDIRSDADGKAFVKNPIIFDVAFKTAQAACPVGAIWASW